MFRSGGFIECQRRDLLLFWVPQVLTDIHCIIGVAIFQHALGDGGRGMFLVGEDANLRSSLNECFVELRPRTAR